MAYINPQQTKAIRVALKKAFPEYKFSVRNVGRIKASVAIISGPAFDIIRQTDGELLEMHSGIVGVNPYSLYNYGKYSEFFSKIVEIIKTAPHSAGVGSLWFDKSDPQTDYFHTAYYIDLSVGRWDKPYTVT